MSSVFQEWYGQMGWKMQSIFANGLRAPDATTKAVKKCVRWLRTMACNNADPNKPDCYMSAPVMTLELIAEALKELEYLPCHYVHHFADAMRVVAIHHPDGAARGFAASIHFQIAEEIFHFLPETDEQFNHRHRDKVEHNPAERPAAEPSVGLGPAE